jgi:hypothetical protein
MRFDRVAFALFLMFAVPMLRADVVGTDGIAHGWRTISPRDEIRPRFESEATGSRSGKGSLVIRHDAREGLDGAWTKTFPVTGGHYYRFEAFRKTRRTSPHHVAAPLFDCFGRTKRAPRSHWMKPVNLKTQAFATLPTS